MAVTHEMRRLLSEKLAVLLPHLDERQQRLLMGAEARMLGHGGIRAVAQAAGVSETTVRKGMAELTAGAGPLGRVRRPGGGRRRAVDADPKLRPALLAMVQPDLNSDPTSPLRWTTKSTRKLAGELTLQGRRVSAGTVAELLRAEGFNLYAAAVDGRQYSRRDDQFRYVNEQARRHIDDGQPVISVDTRKRKLVSDTDHRPRAGERAGVAGGGRTRSGGRQGAPSPHWVHVGPNHDTATFGVALVHHWWRIRGRYDYQDATRLLVTINVGGSEGDWVRVWKEGLATLAAETGLDVTVCHLPSGTSKWTSIEHRLVCHVATDWRGRPLTSHDITLNSIGRVSPATA